MRNQQKILVQVHLQVRILFVLLFSLTSYVSYLSTATVVEKHDLDAHSCLQDEQNCPKKWIMKSYFEDYNALQDSDFEDFRLEKLAPCSVRRLSNYPDTFLKLASLKRSLVGEGSHRHLVSSMKIQLQEGLLNPHSEIIIIERLPSGVFADPFELQHLQERGVFADIAVFGDTNLELPSFRCNRSAVEVHLNACTNSLLDENGLELNLKIPLHAQYQPLDRGGYSTVRFRKPDVFARCIMKQTLGDKTYSFLLVDDGNESDDTTVVWSIPAGIEAHAGVVSVVTFSAAVLAALVIILASVLHSDIKPRKSKQS